MSEFHRAQGCPVHRGVGSIENHQSFTSRKMMRLSRPMGAERKKRVMAGMSGGVDSSAAAALLLEQGYEVVGVTLKLWPQDCVNRAEDKCCGPQAVMDARSVCSRLGIPYYLVDESALFQKQVIQYFADEYKAGRTPNPCVMCNQHLKFGVLIDRAVNWAAISLPPGISPGSRKPPGAAICFAVDATSAKTRVTSSSVFVRTSWLVPFFLWVR